MSDAISFELDDAVAVIRLDDGKANALTPQLVETLGAQLRRAEDEARALVIAGREGRFSAGFDLKVMTGSTEDMRSLVGAGAEMLMQLYGLGVPTVAACTGHALAAGALTLLACDRRIGESGSYKLGLNEVAIGMPLPIFAVELARDRVSKRHFPRATVLGEIYDPEGAVDAGFLDEVVPPGQAVDRAFVVAKELAELSTEAVCRTKSVARRQLIDHVRATLDDDLGQVSGPDAEEGSP